MKSYLGRKKNLEGHEKFLGHWEVAGRRSFALLCLLQARFRSFLYNALAAPEILFRILCLEISLSLKTRIR